jgi:LysR family glycine cleavage system transcriptional activator
MPSLNALRAFEAVLRLGGINAAANEICVTPGAVAQHIKQLEAWLDAPLFHRHARGISPTPEAMDVADELEQVFDDLGRIALTLRSNLRPVRLHIAALPAVAQLWLLPKLPKLREAFPNVDVSVSALEDPPNFARDPYDLGVFYHDAPTGQVILRDTRFPVAAPQVAQTITAPEDLQRCNCLADSVWTQDWDDWSTSFAPKLRGRLSGSIFSLYSLAVSEAVSGAGVLVGHRAMIEPLLARGDLVPVFDGKQIASSYLCLSRPDITRKAEAREELINFLISEG